MSVFYFFTLKGNIRNQITQQFCVKNLNFYLFTIKYIDKTNLSEVHKIVESESKMMCRGVKNRRKYKLCFVPWKAARRLNSFKKNDQT